jgi:ribosomal protein S3
VYTNNHRSNVMENEAKGCELIVSGKLRAARAKAMKFTDGYLVKSGYSVVRLGGRCGAQNV